MVRSLASACGEAGWRWRLWINGVGAIVTGVVLLTARGHEVRRGRLDRASLVIPILVVTFVVMHRHYDEVARRAVARRPRGPAGLPAHRPGADRRRSSRRRPAPLQYARTLAPDGGGARGLRGDGPGRPPGWRTSGASGGSAFRWSCSTSPYRSLLRPLLDYLDQIRVARRRADGHDRAAGDSCRDTGGSTSCTTRRPCSVKGAAALPAEHRRRRRAVSCSSAEGALRATAAPPSTASRYCDVRLGGWPSQARYSTSAERRSPSPIAPSATI